MTRNSLAILVNVEFPGNMVRQYVFRSLEGDKKPYLAFNTFNFGAVVNQGSKITKVIVVIGESGRNDKQLHYYGVEFEGDQGDGFIQAVSRDTHYREDLVTETANTYLYAWM